MHACMHACMYVCNVSVSLCVCVHVFIYEHVHVHVYVYVCTFACMCILTKTGNGPAEFVDGTSRNANRNPAKYRQVLRVANGGIKPVLPEPINAFWGFGVGSVSHKELAGANKLANWKIRVVKPVSLKRSSMIPSIKQKKKNQKQCS